MIVRKFSVCLALLAGLAVLLAGGQAALAAQPSYDTLRIDGGTAALPYEVWVAWNPTILPLPDGSAWAFFSAQTVDASNNLGTRKLWVSKFDPTLATWSAATALPGGQIQFGATAAVDAAGTVHVVYTDRADDSDASFGSVVYIKSNPDGTWSQPVPVAADPNAGHQLSPDLQLDKNGGLHLLWQDQRAVTADDRAAAASNADIFSSDLGADGAWGAPVQVNVRPDATTNASRPQIATDGDRLIAMWSIYDAVSGLNSAARIEWSSRPIDLSQPWSAPGVLMDATNGQIGGRLLDLASDPSGGVDLVFGVRTDTSSVVDVTKLQAGAATWDQPVQIMSGDRGSFPSVAVEADGTVVVAYNIGSGESVQVGFTAYVPGSVRGSVETVATAGEAGAQGRPTIKIDANGKIWLVYMHEPAGGTSDEIRTIRGVVISTELAPEATPVPATPEATPAS